MGAKKAPGSKLAGIAIFTAVTLFVWLGIEAFQRFTKRDLAVIPPEVLNPLTPTLDKEVFQTIKNKKALPETEAASLKPRHFKASGGSTQPESATVSAQTTPVGTSNENPAANAVEGTSSSTGQAPSSSEAIQMVTVEGAEFKFTPDTINVKSGQKTVVTYKNTGKFPHDLVIADLGVKTEVIAGGKETTVEFTPEKSGTFGFICSVGDHEQRGMTGKVVVK